MTEKAMKAELSKYKRKAVLADALIEYLLGKLHQSKFDAIYDRFCKGCKNEKTCHENCTFCLKVMDLMEDM